MLSQYFRIQPRNIEYGFWTELGSFQRDTRQNGSGGSPSEHQRDDEQWNHEQYGERTKKMLLLRENWTLRQKVYIHQGKIQNTITIEEVQQLQQFTDQGTSSTFVSPRALFKAR